MRLRRSLPAAVPIPLVVLLFAGPAWAGGPDLRLTAGGGVGGIGQLSACPDENGDVACDSQASDAALLLGIAIVDSGDSAARAGVRVETLFGFGGDAFGTGATANAMVGLQNEALFLEAGFGGAALYLADDQGDRFGLGLSLHLGVGVNLSREVSATGRLTGAIGERLMGAFVGLSVEWSPWRAPSSPREPWEL